MSTTPTKKAAARKPQDHKPKAPTAAERQRADALNDLDNLSVEVAGETFQVKHPDRWSPTAAEQLGYGSWLGWAASAIEREDQRAFTVALSEAESGALKPQKALLLQASVIAAQDMGEEFGSLSS